jgi:hypothetical protein
MGWSCSKAASDTLKALDAVCVASTNTSNTWKAPDGREYFYEMSRREHDDGAITGEVVELGAPTHCADPHCRECFGARSGRKVGTFRVDGDGTLSRAPAVMRAAMKAPKPGVVRVPFWTAKTRGPRMGCW